ncbi:MAG: adenylate/guanylate cyclase domain-containing protein, partial [Gaiellaceae bacterium]
SGGIIRRVAYAVDGLEAFSLVGAEIVTGRKIDPSELGGGEDGAWIDYHGPPGTIRAISYSQVSEGKTEAGFFRDRIVIVGPSAPSLQDVHPTSTSGDDLMSGAEIQANALSTALRGFPLQSVRQEIDLALIVLLGLIIPLASMRLSLLKVVPLAIGVAALFAVGVQLAFNAGHIVTFLHPFAALVLSTVGALGAYYTIAAFERQRTRDVFSRFVPEAVVDQVLARTDSDLRLGGVRVEGTVMFTDIRGFTTFSETNEAERVIEILNRYLSEMTDAIMENGGTLLSYLGDGILAVFGAPIEQRDHADRALATAREMLGERLSRFNEWAREQGVGDGFRMGVGLHSGPFMAGNVGSERRLEYTAIGDTCNTASRIEGMTKGTPHMLFLAESTRVALLEEPDDLLFVDEFEVRGRQGSVKIWSLADGQAATSALGRETLR